MQQDGILADGIHADFGQGLRFKADTVSAAKNFRIRDGLQILIDQHTAVRAGGQSGVFKQW